MTHAKKSLKELTAESEKFWKPLLQEQKVPYKFLVVLAYHGKEFGEAEPTVRLFKSYLNKGDCYVEVVDWDRNPFHDGIRSLYKLEHNPDWEKNSKDFLPNDHPDSITIKLSTFELVNQTSVKFSTVQLPAIPEVQHKVVTVPIPNRDNMPHVEDPFPMEAEAIPHDAEDAPLATMTLRDEYCIRQNVPFSTKEWLNELIIQGLEWQKKNQTK